MPMIYYDPILGAQYDGIQTEKVGNVVERFDVLATQTLMYTSKYNRTSSLDMLQSDFIYVLGFCNEEEKHLHYDGLLELRDYYKYCIIDVLLYDVLGSY